MKTSRSNGGRSVRIILALLILLLCGSCGKNGTCRLCGAPASSYPCIVELSTGSIAELKPADYGTALFSNAGGISLRSMDTESVTASVPTAGGKIDRALYCDNCLAALDETPDSGYVLADLHDPYNIRLYPLEAGKSLMIQDYYIQIEAGANGEWIVTATEKEWVSP